MIRNSIIVAVVAVLLSLLFHATGLVVVFDTEARVEQEAPPEPAESGAFEDFVDEALEPVTPEPIPEPEPEEPLQPDPIEQALVASDNPQDVEAPDIGTEVANAGQIEADDIVASNPPPEGLQAETPEGTPDAPPETAVIEAEEPQDVIEAVEADIVPDAPLETLTTENPEITVEALEEQGDIEAAEAEDVLASAVTRSLRPPPSRPSEETLGVEDGSEDVTEQPGLASELARTQRSGLDLLAEAGSSALYGRESLYTARATGNAAETNYAGKVLMRLNRSLRVHKNERGSAVIRFQILADGSVGWVRIVRSRGTPGIQIAAQANVRAAGPFPRPPDGKPVELSFTFQSR